MSDNFVMVKKVVKNTILNPKIKVTEKEFFDLVENNEDFIWDELLVRQGKIIVVNREPGEVNNDKFIYVLIKNNYFDDDIWASLGYPHSGYIRIKFDRIVPYEALKYFYDLAQTIDCNIWDRDSEELIDESFLETLRIKEENRGIKLTKEQRTVIKSIEDQCRWFHIPTDEIEKIFNVLNINPEINEGDITAMIEEVQRDCKIAIASFPGHTILWGMNVPYIIYPDLNSYEISGEKFTENLIITLNKLSKIFGSAQYFEYNNDDEQVASLAMSKKGKLVYAKFTTEGMGTEKFGTQKKPMEVTQSSILKTAKKQGMPPEDILINIMKQKMNVKYFEQDNWDIKSMLKRYG